MNLKQKKPIHVRCPKCGHDISYNSNHIEREIERLKKEITDLMGKMQLCKSEYKDYKNDNKYLNLKFALQRRQEKLNELKRTRKATAAEIELQKNIIFRKLIEREMGKEKVKKILQEAEDEMVYYEYDMATQKFTRFEGA